MMEFKEELNRDSRQLLILDQQQETEQVLRAVLEPTGTEVTHVRSWKQLQACKPEASQTVLVLHSEEELPKHSEASALSEIPRVVIGRIEKKTSSKKSSSDNKDSIEPKPSKEHQLDALFEYNDLIAHIQDLFADSKPSE